MPAELERLYDRLHALTAPLCAGCSALGRPFACCEPAACEQAAVDALARAGVLLVPPFLSEAGCLLPAHLRPQCTRYACALSWRREGPSELQGEYDGLIAQIDNLEV